LKIVDTVNNANRMASWQKLLHQSKSCPTDLGATFTGYDAAVQAVADVFPLQVNPYLLSLIRNADDPLGRQFLPHPEELTDCSGPEDPLSEQSQSPVDNLIHRYPGRVAFMVSNRCAAHCRFCMRKRSVSNGLQVTSQTISRGIDYIREHPQINEVLLTGGDPLILGDEALCAILKKLRSIAHVRILRIHTRVAGLLPQRVTVSLARRLAAYHPLYINLHFNHPMEITAASSIACRRLANAGIPLGSQTVLLRNVNDDAAILSELMMRLLQLRVRPYYIHLLDRVRGTAHFQVPLEHAVQLVSSLRGYMSGLAVPHLMVDLPGGAGKVALAPEAIVAREENRLLIRNWQGKIFEYCR
jgi:lysine 2,3-aminomutase